MQAALEKLYYYQLRALARALGVEHRGGKLAVCERIVEMQDEHADEILEAIATLREPTAGDKRKRTTKTRTARTLSPHFERVADDPRPAPQLPPAPPEEQLTPPPARAPAPSPVGSAAPRSSAASAVTSHAVVVDGSPPMIYMPANLRLRT